MELTNASGDINEQFSIDIKDQPFSTPEHVADAIDDEIQSNVSELCDKWNAALGESAGRQRSRSARTNMTPPNIKFGYDRENKRSFWCSISDTSHGFRLRLRKDGQNSILTKLGFSEDTTVEYRPRDFFDDPRVFAKNVWVIGNNEEYRGRSLHQQRVRSDEGFGELRDKFEKKYEIKSRDPKGSDKGRKGMGKRRKDENKEPNDEGEEPNDKAKKLAPHSENLLLAEYLFSLVFLSLYREKGPTMKISANANVSNTCAQNFEDKLKLVCEFVGDTESGGPGSVKNVMEEIVKKARFVF